MTETELKRKTILDKAIDRRLTQKAASEALGISERQVRRLLKRYREDGNEGLVSQQRGKPSNRRLKEDIVEQIKQFINQPIMLGFKPTLMQEKLEEVTGIRVSKETLRKLMITEEVHVAKVKKPKSVHPPRERRERRGELVQIDGSYHAWLEERGPKGCLLLFVVRSWQPSLLKQKATLVTLTYVRGTFKRWVRQLLSIATVSVSSGTINRERCARKGSLNFREHWKLLVSTLFVPIHRRPKAELSGLTRPARTVW